MKGVKNNNHNPKGRPRGSVNKSTADARAAIADFVNGNIDRLNGWLDSVANGIPDPSRDGRWLRRPDPKSAIDCIMSVCEYHIPRLARSELTGPNGAPIETRNLQDIDRDVISRYLAATSKKQEQK